MVASSTFARARIAFARLKIKTQSVATCGSSCDREPSMRKLAQTQRNRYSDLRRDDVRRLRTGSARRLPGELSIAQRLSLLNSSGYVLTHQLNRSQGDSGGPLMLNQFGVWYLVGIVSAGYSCAKQYQPGIYHRVS